LGQSCSKPLSTVKSFLSLPRGRPPLPPSSLRENVPKAFQSKNGQILRKGAQNVAIAALNTSPKLKKNCTLKKKKRGGKSPKGKPRKGGNVSIAPEKKKHKFPAIPFLGTNPKSLGFLSSENGPSKKKNVFGGDFPTRRVPFSQSFSQKDSKRNQGKTSFPFEGGCTHKVSSAVWALSEKDTSPEPSSPKRPARGGAERDTLLLTSPLGHGTVFWPLILSHPPIKWGKEYDKKTEKPLYGKSKRGGRWYITGHQGNPSIRSSGTSILKTKKEVRNQGFS